MKQESLTALILKSRQGDANALEQLLLYAYTSVSYLCKKLLPNDRAAEETTREILSSLPVRLQTLEDPAGFQPWLGRVTAGRCMKKRSALPASAEAAPKNVWFPSKTLDRAQTAQVTALLADALPEAQRLCLLLHSCFGLRFKDIARLCGCSEEDAQTRLRDAREMIRRQLREYEKQGVLFADTASLSALLRADMYLQKDPEAAAAMVGDILKTAVLPAPKKPAGTAIRVLCAVAAVLLLLFLFLLGNLLLRKQDRPAETTAATETLPPTTAPETDVTTVPETTQAPTTQATAEATTEATQAPTEIPETIVSTQPQTSGSGSSANTDSGQTWSGSSSIPVDKLVEGEDHVHTYVYINARYGWSASCESPGWSNFICSICRNVDSFPDPDHYPAKGHDYEAVVYLPTTTSQGYTEYTCTRCHRSYTDNYVDPLPQETTPPVQETVSDPTPEPDPAPEVET